VLNVGGDVICDLYERGAVAVMKFAVWKGRITEGLFAFTDCYIISRGIPLRLLFAWCKPREFCELEQGNMLLLGLV